MDSDIEWTPFSLTYVLYPKGDILGQLMAVLSLIPFGIIVSFITLILFVRDIHVIFFFSGQLINELICIGLKRVFGHSRPVQVKGQPHSNSSYGMPSQHSQFMAFFTFYCLLFFVFRLKRKSFCYKTFLIILTNLLFVSVVYSRIYLLYHYWSQCLVGILFGTLFALMWFSVINFVLEPHLFSFIFKLKISRLLGLTNVYIEPQKNNKSKNK